MGTLAEELARIVNTIVRTCADGHPVVVYYVRRDEPEPACPVCGKVHDSPKGGAEHGRHRQQ